MSVKILIMTYRLLTKQTFSAKMIKLKDTERNNRMKKILCLALALLTVLALLTSCKIQKQEVVEEETTAVETHIAPTEEQIDLSEIASLEGVTESQEQTNYVLISVDGYGQMLVRLYPDVAPKTVANFKDLVSKKFYDGLIFHRVIKNFMMQGGDPLGTGTGGSGTDIFGEFTDNGFENNLHHRRGVVAMARSNDPNSASSQFYICHKDSGVAGINGQYATFGYVVYGIDVVDKIAKVNTNSNDKPLKNVVITSIRFANVPQN